MIFLLKIILIFKNQYLNIKEDLVNFIILKEKIDTDYNSIQIGG